MIIIHATLNFPVGAIDRFACDVPAMLAASRAETGCVAYEMTRDLGDPDVMHAFECWESEALLADHQQTPHFKAFLAKLPKPLSFARRVYAAEPAELSLKPSVAA
jgi:quinol monooxygenase YgiN